MIFNTHSRYAGQHALLSASNYHWLNYSNERLVEYYHNMQQAKRGTELHELAHRCVKLGVKLPKTKQTLNQYVNDAIGYGMTGEQLLFYSPNCFGTADAIGFKKDLLRVHDLKTGVNPGSVNQVRVYAAIFCLEYDFKPGEIGFELRLYQNDEVIIDEPDVDVIAHIMDRIIVFDRMIEDLKLKG